MSEKGEKICSVCGKPYTVIMKDHSGEVYGFVHGRPDTDNIWFLPFIHADQICALDEDKRRVAIEALRRKLEVGKRKREKWGRKT